MPGLSRAHISALTTALTAGGVRVIPGGQEPSTMPVVVLWPEPARLDPNPMSLRGGVASSEVTTVCCGSTQDQALWVADRVCDLLQGFTPDVSGRVAHPTVQLGVGPAARDDSTTPPIHFVSIRWRVWSSPA